MGSQNPFGATEKPVTTVERGDILVVKNIRGKWERGIVYDIKLHPDGSNHPTGFIILPVSTIAKNKTPSLPEGMEYIEKQNKSIVEQAGGNPATHKAIVSYHLKTIVNVPGFTGFKGKNEVFSLGSYAGSNFLTEIMDGVAEAYKKGTLHKNYKIVSTNNRAEIYSSDIARQMAKANSHARRDTFQSLAHGEDSPPISSLKEKLAESAEKMTLESAVEKGFISRVSANFLNDAIVPSTGKAPQTLSHVFELAQNPDKLKQTPGLRNGGKIFQGIIREAAKATAILHPKPPAA